jgi:hemolysin activation/secretion protein
MYARSSLSVLSLWLMAGVAAAQVPAIPASTQPGAVERRIPIPAGRQPQQAAKISILETPAAPPGAEKVSFSPTSVHLAGSTVIDRRVVRAWARQHHTTTVAGVYDFAASLTLRYHKAGFILSRVVVDEANPKTGVVRLRAEEGHFTAVLFRYKKTVRRGQVSSQFKAAEKRIKKEIPANVHTLERELLLINNMPGLSARSQVASIGPARYVLGITVDRKPLSGSWQVDNRGTRYQGPLQGTAGINLNDAFNDGGTLSLRGTVTPVLSQLRYGEVAYRHPLGTEGLSARLRLASSRSKPGFTLAPFDVQERDDRVDAALDYPLLLTERKSLKLSGIFSAENAATSSLSNQIFNDKVRALRARLDWNNNDDLQGTNAATLELSRGIKGLGSSRRGDPSSNPAAKPNFTKLSMMAGREQRIPQSNFSVALTATGQYSDSPLYESEQFNLGGEQFLSAYDSGEHAGDSGAAIRLEPRYTHPMQGWVRGVQGYAFIDRGFTFSRASAQSYHQLESAGVGIRLAAADNYTASVELAKPLLGDVATHGDKDPRIFFKIGKSF